MNFLNNGYLGEDIANLLDYLPRVIFYVKDEKGTFIRCNKHFEEYHGIKRGEAIGLNDFDLHHEEIANRYRIEDNTIMQSGVAVTNRTWMVPSAQGFLRWWSSTKGPIHASCGRISGVAGLMHEVSATSGMDGSFSRIEPALKLIHSEKVEGVSSEELAEICHYSVSQFNRVFRKIMGQSPRNYIMRNRIENAKKLLEDTNLTLVEVAIQVGFYDASDLGKRFRKYEGMTAASYRAGLRGIDR
jgi:PAS domain S-box-containing protein